MGTCFNILSLYVFDRDDLGLTISSKVVSSSLCITDSINIPSLSLSFSLSLLSNNSSKFKNVWMILFFFWAFWIFFIVLFSADKAFLFSKSKYFLSVD